MDPMENRAQALYRIMRYFNPDIPLPDIHKFVEGLTPHYMQDLIHSYKSEPMRGSDSPDDVRFYLWQYASYIGNNILPSLLDLKYMNHFEKFMSTFITKSDQINDHFVVWKGYTYNFIDGSPELTNPVNLGQNEYPSNTGLILYNPSSIAGVSIFQNGFSSSLSTHSWKHREHKALSLHPYHGDTRVPLEDATTIKGDIDVETPTINQSGTFILQYNQETKLYEVTNQTWY